MNGRMLEGEFGERVVEPVARFVESLEGVEGIDGVALLKSTPSNALYIEVIGRFRRGEKSAAEAVGAALEAKLTLSRALRGIVPSGLGFVDSSGITMDDLEPMMREGWSQDPTAKLLQFTRYPL